MPGVWSTFQFILIFKYYQSVDVFIETVCDARYLVMLTVEK